MKLKSWYARGRPRILGTSWPWEPGDQADLSARGSSLSLNGSWSSPSEGNWRRSRLFSGCEAANNGSQPPTLVWSPLSSPCQARILSLHNWPTMCTLYTELSSQSPQQARQSARVVNGSASKADGFGRAGSNPVFVGFHFLAFRPNSNVKLYFFSLPSLCIVFLVLVVSSIPRFFYYFSSFFFFFVRLRYTIVLSPKLSRPREDPRIDGAGTDVSQPDRRDFRILSILVLATLDRRFSLQSQTVLFFHMYASSIQ